MSVHGYFTKRIDHDPRMPRVEEGVPDSAGISWQGDVLTGKLSVAEALRRQAPWPRGPIVAPDQYDPVLRFHLGLK